MEIRIERLTELKEEYVDLITSWNNDPEIKYCLTPNPKQEELKEHTKEQVRKQLLDKNIYKETYLVFDNEILIGEFSIDFKFPYLYVKDKVSAWISLCIGNKDYWSKGVGKIIIKEMENIIKNRDIHRIELGVFEFNVKAKALYEKMGYKQIGVNKKFTYYNKKLYDDIRMEKLI